VWIFYVSMLIPLMIVRFFTYHKANFHYFMLDFCYYMQIWAVLVIVFPNDVPLFKVFFGLCNGPLLIAVIMWQNKMVFHDFEKLTSLFIHIYPPLLSYAIRWRTGYSNPTENDLDLTYLEMANMLLFYGYWQFLYCIKTEWIDAHKFRKDETLMSSARWLSSVRPHPIYRAILKRGYNVTPIQVLVPFQLLYTILTFVPVTLMYKYEWAHLLGILVAFGSSTWFGASYYFETFTDNYSKRLEDKIKKYYESNENPDKKQKLKYLPNSTRSVVMFVIHFTFALGILWALIYITIWRK